MTVSKKRQAPGHGAREPFSWFQPMTKRRFQFLLDESEQLMLEYLCAGQYGAAAKGQRCAYLRMLIRREYRAQVSADPLVDVDRLLRAEGILK